jgi:hypothetical protein
LDFVDMTPMVNGQFPFYDDDTTVASELPLPPHLTLEQAQVVGWIVERFDRRTRPTKKYPAGRRRWVSTPERPVHRDVAIAEVTRRKKEHREQWEDSGGEGVCDSPVYRARNVYTGDVIMGAIL